jgi:hypothetical protein
MVKNIVTHCPRCKLLHLDEGIWKHKPHKTHLCLNCGETWRPYPHATCGVAPMWTFEEVQVLLKNLNNYAVETGWHFALAGGVLCNGASAHDVDIIAYPRTSTKSKREDLYGLLGRLWVRRLTAKELHKHWKAKGGKDRKHVEVWQTPTGKRVDLFILGDKRRWW